MCSVTLSKHQEEIAEAHACVVRSPYPCAHQVLVRVSCTDCAQGRCGRCPPGSGVMSDLFCFLFYLHAHMTLPWRLRLRLHVASTGKCETDKHPAEVCCCAVICGGGGVGSPGGWHSVCCRTRSVLGLPPPRSRVSTGACAYKGWCCSHCGRGAQLVVPRPKWLV